MAGQRADFVNDLIEFRTVDEVVIQFVVHVAPQVGAKGIVVERHQRAAVQEDAIAARGDQHRHDGLHVLLVQILVLPAQVEHALFVRAETVERLAVRPFEFQFGVIGLAVNHLRKGAGGSC